LYRKLLIITFVTDDEFKKENKQNNIAMKKAAFTLLMSLFAIATFAQKPIITFEKDSHDFGEIQEANGTVTYVFNYQNTGTTPLVLHNVQASCGCTTPEWSRTPILPNKSGSIKVTFDPANRPGQFNKTITVQTNGEPTVKQLRIMGNVKQKPKTIEEEYRITMGNMRLKDSHIPFTKLAPDETKIAEIETINTSTEDVTPEFINVPQHIVIASIPATLKPGDKGIIQARYDASKKSDWGFVSDQIYVIFNGERKYNNRLTVSATIAEDFSKMSEKDLKNAPALEVDNKVFEFGVVSQSQKVEHDYIITNKGKDNLIIRKVKASCGCTAVTPEKTILAKGESTKIHVSFDPRGKSGRQNKTITIISNDPKQSNILLRIQGTVSNADRGNN
jgi:hypothetical protein